MADIVMPRLSDSMEEGTIVKWLVSEGASVARGDEIAEIETDKATMTYESDADGVISLVAAEGDTLPIGSVIARLGGESASAPPGAPPQAAAAVQPEEGAPEPPPPAPEPETEPQAPEPEPQAPPEPPPPEPAPMPARLSD